MTRFRAAALAALLFLLPAATASAEEAYISAGGGIFFPGTDYEDTWDNGMAASLSYTMINEYAGLELSAAAYRLKNPDYEHKLLAYGLEALIHFQRTESFFRPFLAVGVSRYSTTYYYDYDGNVTDVDKTSGGGVYKVGARFFLTERFYFSAYYKYVSNKINLYPYTYRAGGGMAFGEIGMVIF